MTAIANARGGGGCQEVKVRWRWPSVLFLLSPEAGWHSKVVKEESLKERERERERERSHHGQRELENKNHDKLNVSIVQVQKLVFIDILPHIYRVRT